MQRGPVRHPELSLYLGTYTDGPAHDWRAMLDMARAVSTRSGMVAAGRVQQTVPAFRCWPTRPAPSHPGMWSPPAVTMGPDRRLTAWL